jgi:hypothetical protein
MSSTVLIVDDEEVFRTNTASFYPHAAMKPLALPHWTSSRPPQAGHCRHHFTRCLLARWLWASSARRDPAYTTAPTHHYHYGLW